MNIRILLPVFVVCMSTDGGLQSAFSHQPDSVLITFLASVPQRSEPLEVFLSGNWNSWDPGKDSLRRVGNGTYRAALLFPKGYRVEYKYTRGDRYSVETDADTVDIQNRVVVADADKSVRDTVLTWWDDMLDTMCRSGSRVDRIITFEKGAADIAFTFRVLEETHPQLLANISAEEYLTLKRHAADTLRAMQGPGGGLYRHHLCRVLSRIFSAFKDVHTGMQFISQMIDSADTGQMAPPFTLRFEDGKPLIYQTLGNDASLQDAELMRINGVPLETFMEPAKRLITAETESQKLPSFIDEQGIYWHFTQPLDAHGFTITVRDARGRLRDTALTPIPFARFSRLLAAGSMVSPDSHFQFYQDGKTCYFDYRRFEYSDEQMHLIDSMFAAIKQRGCTNLIIDIRNNEGGHSGMGDYIINYLTSKPYRQFSRSDLKLSSYAVGRFYRSEKALRGLIITYRSDFTAPKDMGYKFAGRFFLLAGPQTYSSAGSFANTVKDFHLGTIIGEETGQRREAFGDVLAFYTPNYKVQFSCSTKKFYSGIPGPDDLEHGTVPDIPMTNERILTFRSAKDPTLAFTLDYIRKK